MCISWFTSPTTIIQIENNNTDIQDSCWIKWNYQMLEQQFLIEVKKKKCKKVFSFSFYMCTLHIDN